MLKNARVNASLPAKDLARARAFYADKLGLVPVREGPQGLASFLFYEVAAGDRFLIFQSAGTPSGQHTQMGFQVDDIAGEVKDLRARGVVFEAYDSPGLKTVDGIAEAGGAKSAWFKDSEGNMIAVVQPAAVSVTR
jgi:catechol 2,3-dioxygenase-like lactoylglutathione lyase family enzyme